MAKIRLNPKSIVSRTISLYNDLDKFIKNSNPPKCQINCCDCCSDYFHVSEPEFYTLLYYVINKYGDDYLKEKIKYSKKAVLFLKEQYPNEYIKLTQINCPISYNDLFDIPKTLKIKCPFLCNGKCDIYECRPFICRVFGITKDNICNKAKGNNIDINLFIDNGRLKRLFFPREKVEKPYPIIDWLASMSELMLFSGSYVNSYSLDSTTFYLQKNHKNI